MPVWWVLLALGLAGGAAWGAVRLWRIVAIGAAYKAKVLSMTIFGAGREVDPQSAPEVSADSYWLLRLFQVRIDRAQQTVTASLVGLRPRSVMFRSRPSDPRTTAAFGGVGCRSRVGGSGACCRCGVRRTGSNTPQANESHRRRSGRPHHRRAICGRIQRWIQIRRMVHDQERAERTCRPARG